MDAALVRAVAGGENQANMFTVNTLRQSVNESQAPSAQKLGSQFGCRDDICEFVPIVPADRGWQEDKSPVATRLLFQRRRVVWTAV